jgi:2-hydroxychromene-2-carboxylate isomerase
VREVAIWVDVVCPYAYLASTQIEALAQRASARVVWEPLLLGGVFRAIGQSDDPNQSSAGRAASACRCSGQRRIPDAP